MIEKIVIVGGGTAGWITANHLAKVLQPNKQGAVEIVLVESPDIPTVGVGEGTVPAMRDTLAHFGISETEFFRQCDATFKQSIRFVDWTQNPEKNKEDFYHHIFDYPAILPFDTVPYWLKHRDNSLRNSEQNDCQRDRSKFASTMSAQAQACEQGLAPKLITHPEFQGFFDYAYHLDAQKFSKLLAHNAIEILGVKLISANVTAVNVLESGDIQSVETDRAGTIKADFFVDCTGFRSLLLGEALGVSFVDKKSTLFVDHALAVQVPYSDIAEPIASSTIATAKDAGWIWDIGLTKRRGVGYVYSSQHTEHDAAEAELRSYIGAQAENLEVRKIPMRIGHREKFWKNNCVAIGLSQGFVEPLEATGLLLFDATAKMLANLLPSHRDDLSSASKLFNQRTLFSWERVIDFIKLHYFISNRNDSSFWRDNTNPDSAPDSLLEKLAIWKRRPPSTYDFFSRFETFNLDNYLYVLYGMDFKTDVSSLESRYTEDARAIAKFEKIRDDSNWVNSQLENNRQLVDKIIQFGLQKN